MAYRCGAFRQHLSSSCCGADTVSMYFHRPNHACRIPLAHMVLHTEGIPHEHGTTGQHHIHRFGWGVGRYYRLAESRAGRAVDVRIKEQVDFWSSLARFTGGRRGLCVWSVRLGYDLPLLGFGEEIERGTFRFWDEPSAGGAGKE